MVRNFILNIIDKISSTIDRFPLPCFFILVNSILIYCNVFDLLDEKKGLITKGTSLKIAYGSICGCLLFVSLKLIREAYQWSFVRYYTLGTILFSILSLYIYTSTYYYPSFIFVFLGLFFSIFIAASLLKESSNIIIWKIKYHIWKHLFFTALLVSISSIAFLSIIGSLYFFFDIKIFDFAYRVILLFTLLFGPIIAISGVPENDKNLDEYIPKALNFILSYIIVPSLLFYTVILYGYIIKIIISWELPKGGVVYIISSFSFIGIVTYLLTYPLHKKQGLINFFSRAFFKILLGPLILFFVAIGVRINEYGITEGRYTVLLFLILLILSTFFALTKYKNQFFKLTLSTLIILLLFSSFGPWRVENISSISQVGRLKYLLESNKILVNEKIEISNKNVSYEDISSIKSIVRYLTRKKDIERIKPWIFDIKELSKLNLLENKYKKSFKEEKNYSLKSGLPKDYINTFGYDYLVSSKVYYSDTKKYTSIDRINIKIKLNSEENNLIFISDKEEIKFDLNDLVSQKSDNFIIDQRSSNVEIRLLIDEVGVNRNKEKISYIKASFLIKNIS